MLNFLKEKKKTYLPRWVGARQTNIFLRMALYRENMKNCSSLKPQGLETLYLPGKQHDQVDLYQVCSNKAPWARNGPAPGVKCFK